MAAVTSYENALLVNNSERKREPWVFSQACSQSTTVEGLCGGESHWLANISMDMLALRSTTSKQKMMYYFSSKIYYELSKKQKSIEIKTMNPITTKTK